MHMSIVHCNYLQCDVVYDISSNGYSLVVSEQLPQVAVRG